LIFFVELCWIFYNRTTPIHPSTIYDCDFESAACSSWNIISKPELSWTRVQASAAAQDDAHNPIYDHTQNQAQGYYLLLTPDKAIPYPNVRKHLKSFL
jgi:hypothetical protein